MPTIQEVVSEYVFEKCFTGKRGALVKDTQQYVQHLARTLALSETVAMEGKIRAVDRNNKFFEYYIQHGTNLSTKGLTDFFPTRPWPPSWLNVNVFKFSDLKLIKLVGK
jgi:hypothetical protein